MDLINDLFDDKWEYKGQAPQKTRGTGYNAYDILHATTHSDHIEYLVSGGDDTPNKNMLYGAKRDPLKNIGHCKLKFANRNNNHVIVGIIVEDDWVEMKDSFLQTINPPEYVDKSLKKQESINLGLISDLQKTKWCSKGKPPRNKSSLGYKYYTLLRSHPEHDEKTGNFKYCLSDDSVTTNALLNGASRDPLKSVGNCFLKIVKEEIHGIIIEDDWVEKI
ncbi:uncharacterized protein LOC100200457 [Hydra vulgaris]|uniref:uncharacterized protein LOC100200457 n=1 Tax=Hydra vulgaris TaxID=6087 RepID=UPI0001925196|nr:uncharacterized protein LOC100200457 [Hydra vulgaris]XP_012553523.1 uncharacterized protein LOC100200457 [Hydra vulgaris]